MRKEFTCNILYYTCLLLYDKIWCSPDNVRKRMLEKERESKEKVSYNTYAVITKSYM